MKSYAYNELALIDGKEAHLVITKTEQQVLNMYWPYWSSAMLAHGGLSPRITEQNCIEDFVIVNWAWEVTE